MHLKGDPYVYFWLYGGEIHEPIGLGCSVPNCNHIYNATHRITMITYFVNYVPILGR